MKDWACRIALLLVTITVATMSFMLKNAGAEINTLKSEVEELKADVETREIVVNVETIEVEPEPVSLGTFKLTAYCHCEKCCGKSDGITASGAMVTANHTIAVDPDIIPLGTEVIINGQSYIAEDTGGAINGNRIDIYFPTHQEALNFGVQYADVCIVGGDYYGG